MNFNVLESLIECGICNSGDCRPSTSFLAGRNSVYRGIPKQVAAASFNVDEGKLRELGRDQEIIFPPRSGREQEQRRKRHDEEEQSRKRHDEELAWAIL